MKHLWANVLDVVCWVLALPMVVFLGYRSYVNTEDRRGLMRRWIISAALLVIIGIAAEIDTPIKVFLIIPSAVALGFMWVPAVTSILLKPLTSSFDGGDEVAELKPFYFIAEGKRRKGLYEEAIAEVRRQLEMFPGDFDGYMKLASIQMEDLKDFPAAQATLNEFLALPDRLPNHITAFLNLLADWQLQFGKNTMAAAAALQRIVQLYPGSPFAHAAEQRLAHLGSADEANRARFEKKFTVPHGGQQIGLNKETSPVAAAADRYALADEYVKQLKLHPSDTDTREKLAVLYAEEFQRLDMAADQLEQLIALPTESPKHVARWLNLLATLRIQHGHDLPAAESALHRIIERFPGGALATLAVSRLASLHAELKNMTQTQAKTIGLYEKDIGLKHSNG